jgi:UDP-glucose 4-epimerase
MCKTDLAAKERALNIAPLFSTLVPIFAIPYFHKENPIKALVTGGAGFIGSNIVAHLLQEGHEVVVLDNLLSGYRQNLFAGARFTEGDVRDERTVAEAVQGVEVVFHLAASVGNTRSIEHPIDDSEINVIGTLRILEAARTAGVRKVVFSSSAGIFGELKTLPIREDHPVEPDSPYGASKLAAEKMCLAYHKLYGLEAACLRYFNVYGVRQRYDAYGNVIPIFAHRILNETPITIFGDGEQTRDFVNVRDVVQANYKAALSHASGAFNIASATSITINELAKLMLETSGLYVPIEYAAPRKGDVRHSLADVSAAHAAFGYSPSVGLHEGLTEYMAWARHESV